MIIGKLTFVCTGAGISSLAAVPSANAIVASWAASDDGQLSRTAHNLRMFDPRQEEPVAAIGYCTPKNDAEYTGRGVILSVFSPPSCGKPIVLATLDTGAVVSVDLRMLGKDSPSSWPVVVAPEAAGGLLEDCLRTVTGGGQTLVAARRKGALVGVFGRSEGEREATDAAGSESNVEKWERLKQERKEKKLKEQERKAAKATKKQTKDAGRRQTTGKQGGRSKGSR